MNPSRVRPLLRSGFGIAAIALGALACASGTTGNVDSATAGAFGGPPRAPKYLSSWSEKHGSERLMRITGDAGVAFTVGGKRAVWGKDTRHHYSRDQPWNADGTLLAIENRNGGTPSMLILDGNTYEPRATTCATVPLDEFRWHPSRAYANVQIGVRGDSLLWVDVVNCRRLRGWKLPFKPKGIGMSEGNPSNDGRFIALANQDSIVVIDMDPKPPQRSYDAGGRRIGPVYLVDPCSVDVATPLRCNVGNVSISASGKYVDLKFAASSSETITDAHRILEIDSTTLAMRPHRMAASSDRCAAFQSRPNGWIFPLKHADLTLDPFDGNEDVIIGGRSCPGSNLGRVVKVRLRDGKVTPLTDPRNEASVGHVSTRNIDRLGWAYVTYLPGQGKQQSGEIVAVKIDGSRTVEPIVQHHSVWKGCYRCEAQAVPSRDGRRVLFASNWAESCPDCKDRIHAYVAELPGKGK